MIHFPFRPGQSSPVLIGMLGALLGLIVAGFIFVPIVLRSNGNQSQSSSSSSARAAEASSTSVTQSSVDTSGSLTEIDACIAATTRAHNQRWAQACAEESVRMQRAYDICIANGKDQSYCQEQFGAYSSLGSSCELPLIRQKELNVVYAAAKAVCQNKAY